MFALTDQTLAFRFVRAADENQVPLAILNIGPTRADDLNSLYLKVEEKVQNLAGECF